ncbi:MAG: hypothetical protein IJP43_03425 [Oscillospiraceae bacterium]|nr:hypothetical protein [Oscillospiraceae bacterium]
MEHKARTKALSWLLSLALMLGLLPGMSLPAQAAASPKVTLDFTDYGWGIPNSNTTALCSYTNGTYSIELYGTGSNGYKQNSGFLILGKENSYLKLPAFDFAVAKIVVTGHSGASTSVKTNIFVGDNAVSTEVTGSTGTNTFEIASAYQTAGNVYKLKINSNHNAQITKIEIYEKESVSVSSVTFDSSAEAISAGDIVAITASVKPDGPNGADDRTVKWGVNNSNVKLYFDSSCNSEVGMDATSALTVYAKGMSVGDATVTVTSNADNTKSATCAVTVNTPSAYNAYTVKSSDTYDTLQYKVVGFNNMDWYIIEDNSTAANAGTVTLLATGSMGQMKFNEETDRGNDYDISNIAEYIETFTYDGNSFASVADAIKTVTLTTSSYDGESSVEYESVKLYLLSTSEAQALPEAVRAIGEWWWLRSPGDDSTKAACVNSQGVVYDRGSSVTYEDYIRPALQLDLSKVTFNSESRTFDMKPTHAHAFTGYTVNGATITTTCMAVDREAACPLKDSEYVATLTICAPTAGGGSATLTGFDDFGVTAENIEYSSNGGSTWSTEAPSGNGFYMARITVSDGAETPTTYTATVTYGVNAIKKDESFNAAEANGDFDVPAVAAANATVTITTVPATGYELKDIKVTKDGDKTTVAADKDGNNGTFTMPAENVTVTATFQLHDYSINKSDMTNGGVTVAQTAKMGDTVTVTVNPATGYELETLTVKDSKNGSVTVTNNAFVMPADDVTISATFKKINYTITNGVDSTTAHGSVTVAATAQMDDTVTVTVNPDVGYELGELKFNDTAITPDTDGAYKFTMPAENVTVTATFALRDVTVKLNADADDTACAAELLTEDFAPAGESFTSRAGETFVLRVSTDEDYDYTIKFNDSMDGANAALTVFSDEDYTTYAKYLEDNGLAIPAQTDLYRVTMPVLAEGDLNIAVTFGEVKSFTVLYQPTTAVQDTETVWCKFTNSENQTYAAEMTKGLNMNGVTVWSVSLKSAFDPNQIAFIKGSKDADTDTLQSALDGASLTACSAQTNTDWKAISGDQYMVIGGNAKAVATAFVDGDEYSKFEIAVCPTDEQGNVTTAGTVTAPAAPAKTGYTFKGWRGFKYDESGKASEEIYAAGAVVPVYRNTTLSAVWAPVTPNVKFNPNNGGEIISIDATYGDPIMPQAAEKAGYILENWTVGKSVTESGKFFSKGSTFDFNTGITEDLELNANWKHVHSYTCVPVDYSAFGDALEKYYKYRPYLHIEFCSCLDVHIVAHTFNESGLCTGCGYTKPNATEAKLEVSYWKDGAASAWMTEDSRTVKINEEVTVDAFDQIGSYAFSKWQYSTDNGQTWEDLAAATMVGFIIPCSVQVRALYVSTITEPQISLSARNYITQAQGYNWKSVLFQMNYKIPDGYTFVDAGIRMGDNGGISYYEMKEYKQSTGQKAAVIGADLAVNCIPFVGGGLSGFLTNQTMNLISGDDGPQYYYESRENNVLDEYTAATLSEYMYESKPVNVEKYPPIYWETKAQTKSQTGSVNTLTPLSFIQKNNGKHYIYGMAYLTYKDSTGEHTIYTEALPVTRDSIPNYTVKATPNGMTH